MCVCACVCVCVCVSIGNQTTAGQRSVTANKTSFFKEVYIRYPSNTWYWLTQYWVYHKPPNRYASLDGY